MSITKVTYSMINAAPINILDLGATNDNTTDTTSAFNAAVTLATNSTNKTIYFPAGQYNFSSKPADIAADISIVGDGKGITNLYRAFSGGSNSEGLFNFLPGSQSNISELGIIGKSGTTGGCLISVISSASAPAGFCSFSNLYLSSEGNTHAYSIYIDGSAKTTAPVGARDIFITNCSIFGGTSGSIYAKSCVALHIANCDTFSAGGTSGKIVVTGTASVPTNYFSISGAAVNGLTFDYCTYGQINVGVETGGVYNTANVNYLVLVGYISTFQTNWNNCNVYSTDATIVGTLAAGNTTISGTLHTGSTTIGGNLITYVNNVAPSLSDNQTLTFELASNTSLKIYVRGSDGTTRSTTLTLS